MNPILFVFPTQWDAKQLDSCRPRWEATYTPLFGEPNDVDCPAELDIVGYVTETARRYRGQIRGVTSSSDYPGATVAAAVAQELGLAGPTPDAVLRCSHKYLSRLRQQEAAPAAVPQFALVDARHPDANLDAVPFPCFVKPVKGAFSIFTRRIDTPADLVAFLSNPAVAQYSDDYLAMFNALVRTYAGTEIDGHFFLAEAVLRGTPATVEGFVSEGEVTVLGVVDSTVHPGTRSFARFDYPSALPANVQDRLSEIARRVITRLGLDRTFFNIEVTYDATADRIGIIEVNPRFCGQFADLYAKVDGTNAYEIALALAAGRPPPHTRGSGPDRVASSIPLRIFAPARVHRAPDAAAIRAVETRFPGTLVWVECAPGDAFTDMEWAEDGESFRYAVVNVGAASAADRDAMAEAVTAALDFAFEPVPATPAAG